MFSVSFKELHPQTSRTQTLLFTIKVFALTLYSLMRKTSQPMFIAHTTRASPINGLQRNLYYHLPRWNPPSFQMDRVITRLFWSQIDSDTSPPLTVVTTVAVEEVLFLFQYLYVASMLRAQEAERCHFTREIQNDRARDPVRTTRNKNFKHPIPKTRNQLYITATSQSTDFYEQHPFSKERTCPSGMRAPWSRSGPGRLWKRHSTSTLTSTYYSLCV